MSLPVGTYGRSPGEGRRFAFLLRLPFLLPISEETVHRLPVAVHSDRERLFVVDISVRHLVADVPVVLDHAAQSGFLAIAECGGMWWVVSA